MSPGLIDAMHNAHVFRELGTLINTPFCGGGRISWGWRSWAQGTESSPLESLRREAGPVATCICIRPNQSDPLGYYSYDVMVVCRVACNSGGGGVQGGSDQCCQLVGHAWVPEHLGMIAHSRSPLAGRLKRPLDKNEGLFYLLC